METGGAARSLKTVTPAVGRLGCVGQDGGSSWNPSLRAAVFKVVLDHRLGNRASIQ